MDCAESCRIVEFTLSNCRVYIVELSSLHCQIVEFTLSNCRAYIVELSNLHCRVYVVEFYIVDRYSCRTVSGPMAVSTLAKPPEPLHLEDRTHRGLGIFHGTERNGTERNGMISRNFQGINYGTEWYCVALCIKLKGFHWSFQD